MGHDASKVLMGATANSFKVVTNAKGEIAAGLAVRQKSDGTISKAKADGELLGISLGKDLSNTDFTAIVRQGLQVPVLVQSGSTPVLGAQVGIDDTTGEAADIDTGVTGVNAVYSKVGLTGVKEDGTTATVALIDFQGGL